MGSRRTQVLIYFVNADATTEGQAIRIGRTIAAKRFVGGPSRDRIFWVLTEGTNRLHSEVAGLIAVELGCTSVTQFGAQCNSFALRHPYRGPWPADDLRLATWLYRLPQLPYGIVVVGGGKVPFWEDVAAHGWHPKLITVEPGKVVMIQELTEIG